jgi:hypothetical protein
MFTMRLESALDITESHMRACKRFALTLCFLQLYFVLYILRKRRPQESQAVRLFLTVRGKKSCRNSKWLYDADVTSDCLLSGKTVEEQNDNPHEIAFVAIQALYAWYMLIIRTSRQANVILLFWMYRYSRINYWLAINA